MVESTNNIREKSRSSRKLDKFDRKILGALTENSNMSYAALGKIVNLSPPATHERVKRLRKNGTIINTAARINGTAIGKPLLSFVHVDADGWGKSQRMIKLTEFPEVEEMHSVAGDTCVILKVRTENAMALEHFLAQLYVLPGVRSTKTFVVLSTLLERPVQAGVTCEWPDIPLPPDR